MRELYETYDILKNRLTENKIVFFAGSGISIGSGLPSAQDILERTCKKILPSLTEAQLRSITEAQPEVIYAVLLECSNNNTNCLDMWKCLSPKKWTKEYFPKANFEHCFIVAYSKRAKVPIFTVNYDTMFEDACEFFGMRRGIDYIVMTDCPDSDIFHNCENTLFICKLHGDIDEVGDRVDPDAFKTTMKGITKKNEPWLKYLYSLMEEKHICFVGYSGRDIDFYPFMKDHFNVKKDSESVFEPFWCVGGERDVAVQYAKRIDNVHIIAQFPSEFFSLIYYDVFSEGNYTYEDKKFSNHFLKSKLQTNFSEAKEDSFWDSKKAFLDRIQEEIRDTKITDKVFWVRFLRVWGNNRQAEEVLDHSFINDLSELEIWEQLLLLDTKMMVKRELADFIGYRNTARTLFRIASKEKKRATNLNDRKKAEEQQLNACVQIISSYQMEVPSHLYFRLPFWLKGIQRILMVKVGFVLLDIFVLIKGKNFLQGKETIIQECRLRSYAINVHAVERLQKIKFLPFSSFLQKCVIYQLKKLHEAAYNVGNYFTIIGTQKYLTRLCPSAEWDMKTIHFSEVVSDLSSISIVKRDTSESVSDYEEALKIAKENGNTLNIVKNLLGIAFFRKNMGEKELLSTEYAVLLQEEMERVKSNHLRKCFAYIKKKYL